MLRGDALRRWPAESYAGVVRALRERGLEVVLVGGPDDAWDAPVFEGLGAITLIGEPSSVTAKVWPWEAGFWIGIGWSSGRSYISRVPLRWCLLRGSFRWRGRRRVLGTG